MAKLIDADRAMEIIHNQGIAHPNAYHLTNYATLILREAPTVDAVEVVRCRDCNHYKPQRWEQTEAPFMNECEDCSVCGYRTVWGHRFNYCPNCGARMDGGADDGT